MQLKSREEQATFSAQALRVKAAEDIVEVTNTKRRRGCRRKENFKKKMKMKKISISIKKENLKEKFFEEKRKKIRRGLLVSGKKTHFSLMPATPHNTGQYLVHNFTKSRKENVFNLISNYTNYLDPQIEEFLTEDILTVEDLCVSGGSMTNIILSRGGPITLEEEQESHLDQIEEKTNFTNFTPKGASRLSQNSSEYEEESTIDENNLYVSVNPINDKLNKEIFTRGINISDYRFECLSQKVQIFNQNREIHLLLEKLRRRDYSNANNLLNTVDTDQYKG